MDVTSEESVKDAFRLIKIQPGPVKSEMTGSGEQQFKEADNASIHFNKALAKGASFLPRVYRNACDPDVVIRSVERALESSRPRIAYRVKQDKLRRLIDLLPVRWADLLFIKVLSK
jgi:hypothetical protein